MISRGGTGLRRTRTVWRAVLFIEVKVSPIPFSGQNDILPGCFVAGGTRPSF